MLGTLSNSLMESLLYPFSAYRVSKCSNGNRFSLASGSSDGRKKHSQRQPKQLPTNIRHRRQTSIPPDFHPILHRRADEQTIPCEESDDYVSDGGGDIVWETDEIEAISSLFQGRVPQKPGNLNRERPLPLPLPHKVRPLGLPAHKNLGRTHLACANRLPVSNQIYKNPAFLINLARDIRNLNPEDNVSTVLNQWGRFMRKGSLSLTVRELGHMGLPDRALHVFCWVQKQPHLFPDDRVLASTIEVLARANALKMPFDWDKFISLASRSVYESMVKGCIKGGNLRLAWKLVSAATDGKRMLDSSVYAKLILELGKNPDKSKLALHLLEELAKRDELKLTQQDCTGVMKVCIKLGRFDIVEALYDWFKKTESIPSVVMYTTLLHSRFSENRYRDAMAVVWEMEAANCVLDLPAYRVLIKLFVALQDLSRTGRYYSKLKESGFSPTYDIYRDLIGLYGTSGRVAKCKEIFLEAELAGFKLDERMKGEFCN